MQHYSISRFFFGNRIAKDHTLNVQNGLRSHVNIPIESQQATSCVSRVLEIAMFVLSFTVCHICHRCLDIHSRKMHNIDLDFYIRPLSCLHMSNERQSMTFYFKTILIFALSVTVCEIFAVEICINFILTFRMGKGQM